MRGLLVKADKMAEKARKKVERVEAYGREKDQRITELEGHVEVLKADQKKKADDLQRKLPLLRPIGLFGSRTPRSNCFCPPLLCSSSWRSTSQLRKTRILLPTKTLQLPKTCPLLAFLFVYF